MPLGRYFPWLDLRHATRADLSHDVVAGVGVAFLAVPQAVAYAMIAGLPPAVGLYAAAVPVIIGGLFRSSRHVVTGPSNALSLLVGAAVAAAVGADPVEVALTLALMVGAMQVAAGALRLGVLVDYISRPVVLGYVTGAGSLILIGQLPNVTGSPGVSGQAFARLGAWVAGLGDIRLPPLLVALGTAALVLGLRRVDGRIPGAIVAMAAGIVLGFTLDTEALGLRLISDLAPIPPGLPPLTVPRVDLAGSLLWPAVACAVLSLVESTSVARSVARETGQRLDRSVEITGQGLANIAAAFVGGYPTSGSLARTAIGRQLGSRTRFASVLSGALVLMVLLFMGPIVDHTPIANLAGLLLVVGFDLIDVPAIRTVLAARAVDRLALVGTVIGTWILPLDQAIYVGVGISLVLFLRRARLLVVQEMLVGEDGRLHDVSLGETVAGLSRCSAIRIIQLQGALFFGAAGELSAALDKVIADPDVRVLIVRVKRTIALDVTTASILAATAERLGAREGHLLLAGMRTPDMSLLHATRLANRIGPDNLFPSEPGIFVAMGRALDRARDLSGEHGCGDGCPMLVDVALPPE